MTKFDIFVVNLERSVDRREAMREKIARIKGFRAIYIDGELVCKGNSPLELHSADFGIFGASQTPSLVSRPKFAENYESQTENPSVVLNADSTESSLRGRIVDSREAIQNFCDSKNDKNQIARSATLKALSGAGVGVVREGEGSDFAIQAPTPSLKKNARRQKGEFNADLSAELRKSIESESLESFRKKGCTPRPAPPTRQKAAAFSLLGGEPRFSDSSKKSADALLRPLIPIFCTTNRARFGVLSHDSLELHFHFFPATDATDFKNEKSPLPPQYSSKLTRFVKGKDLSFGEMACFSSHYRLWQKCVALDSPIIVLEDDIDFMQDFCQIVDIFKSPFEYVRLHYTMDKKTTHLRDNFYMSYDKVCGTLGYYLTPQAAQKFIKNARFWLFCVDDYMDMFFIHSVKNIIFKPFIISEDLHSATQSTILGREKPQMRFYQKLTRELSRIYFFVIRKYLYFALHCVELRAFFRANRQ